MSDTSTATIPYVRASTPGWDSKLSLHPNFVYKAARDDWGNPTLLKQRGTSGTPSLIQASRLDTNSDKYRCGEDAVLMLVTEKEERPLELGSFFYTDAENTVRFPTRLKPEGILRSDGHTTFASTSKGTTKRVRFDPTVTQHGD